MTRVEANTRHLFEREPLLVLDDIAEEKAEGILVQRGVETVAKERVRDQQVVSRLFFVDPEAPPLEQHVERRRENVQRPAQPLYLAPQELQLLCITIVEHRHGLLPRAP